VTYEQTSYNSAVDGNINFKLGGNYRRGSTRVVYIPGLGFSKIRNFNGRSAVRDECASSCQISSKSVKRLQRHDNLTVFKMAAVRHLGFVKFKFF